MKDRDMALDACDSALKQDIAKAAAAYADSVVISHESPETAAKRLAAGLVARKAAYASIRAIIAQVFSEGQPPT
jgi:hypothetical protein